MYKNSCSQQVSTHISLYASVTETGSWRNSSPSCVTINCIKETEQYLGTVGWWGVTLGNHWVGNTLENHVENTYNYQLSLQGYLYPRSCCAYIKSNLMLVPIILSFFFLNNGLPSNSWAEWKEHEWQFSGSKSDISFIASVSSCTEMISF